MKKKSKVVPLFASLIPTIAAISMLLSSSAVAQMRPECTGDPSTPGACFFAAPVGGIGIGCEDGIVVTGPALDLERGIGRFSPNGKIAAYQTARLVHAGACRAEDFASGICGTLESPGPGVYFGDASFQANGFITQNGDASCPLKATLKGTLYRDVGYGLEEVELDAVLHKVKDTEAPGGCRFQLCRVFSPADGE